MGRWNRHFDAPAYPTMTVVQGNQHSGMLAVSTNLTAEIETAIKTRAPPKNPNFVCTINKKGGCSKSFPSVRELAKWIAEQEIHVSIVHQCTSTE